MRWLTCVFIGLVFLSGCAGATRVKYNVVSPDHLPAELADWKTRQGNGIDVIDTVVGSDTYMRIVVGPCPSSEIKVNGVSVNGHGIWIEGSMAENGQGQYYPTVILRVSWDMRTRYAPQGMNLQINGQLPQSFTADERPDVRPGVRPGAPDTFRPSAVYVPRGKFVCTGLPKSGSRQNRDSTP